MGLQFQGSVRSFLDVQAIRTIIDQASIDPLKKAGLLVERNAKIGMRSGGGRAHIPSKPGEPPHVQTGNLRASIQSADTQVAAFIFGALRTVVIVGPTRSAFYGRMHEFGGTFKGVFFPARPFMRPSLLTSAPKFPAMFKNMDLVNTPAATALQRKVDRFIKTGRL